MKTGRRYKDMPLKIVGSTKFGRYPKMSSEETFNMIISDGWLVPFAGYKRRVLVNPTGEGRGIYSSTKLNKLFAVIDNDVYMFDGSLSRTLIGTMTSFKGDVFIAENDTAQIAFSDSENIYIYQSGTGVFTTLTAAALGFKPGYLTFQDGRFISPDTLTNQYRLSEVGNGLLWPFGPQYVGEVSTKPSRAVACVRFPSKGNLLLVFGGTVAELWYDVGAQLFPYQRSQSTNIDYGCLNPATIAENESMVCWVGVNEQSGPAIMYTTGNEVERISTDGIDFKLAQLNFPRDCYGFMLRLLGHLCYVVSWPKDNLSYVYDFNTKSFFTLTDENMSAFIAKKVAFFNDEYYFVSIRDGNLYQLSPELFSYQYGEDDETDFIYEIPCIRVTPNIQLPDQSPFITGYTGFTIEQGSFPFDEPATDYVPRIDLSVSKDGGVNFSSNVQKKMRPQGVRKNRLLWRNLGWANDLVQQFRFHGIGGPFVCTDGVTGVYQ